MEDPDSIDPRTCLFNKLEGGDTYIDGQGPWIVIEASTSRSDPCRTANLRTGQRKHLYRDDRKRSVFKVPLEITVMATRPNEEEFPRTGKTIRIENGDEVGIWLRVISTGIGSRADQWVRLSDGAVLHHDDLEGEFEWTRVICEWGLPKGSEVAPLSGQDEPEE